MFISSLRNVCVLAVLATLSVPFAARAALSNPGFESGTTSWNPNIPSDAVPLSPTITVVTDAPHGGTKCVRLYSSPTAAFTRYGVAPSTTIAVTPGQRYRFTGWVKAGADFEVSANAPGALVRVNMINASNQDAAGGHLFLALDNWVARDREAPARASVPTAWTKIEAVFEIPAGVAAISPTLFVWRARGTLYFDDIACDLVAAGTALSPLAVLTNPGFEDGTAAWSTLIPTDAQSVNPTFTASTDTPHSGAQCAKLYSPASAASVRYGICPDGTRVKQNVLPGERYRFTGWIRAGADFAIPSGSPGATVRVSLYNPASQDVPGGHIYLGLDSWVARDREPAVRTSIPTTWTKIDVVFEVPAGVSSIVPTLFVWRGRGTLYFDDISCDRVSVNTLITAQAAPPPTVPTSLQLLTTAIQNDLFASLDLDLPALSAVRSAVIANDLTTARQALATYLRSRTGTYWTMAPFNGSPYEPTSAYHTDRANNAKIGKVTPSDLAELWHTFPGNIIEWFYNETRYHPELAYNAEWQWQLCRMSFWENMGFAYRATGNAEFPAAWVIQLRSFFSECQPPATVAGPQDFAWRTIEAGIRMRYAWPLAYQAFLKSPVVSNEDLLLYMYSTLQHARYLKAFPSAGTNFLTMEMCGLHTVGTFFPEFKDATTWRTFAIETMRVGAQNQFLPDGAQYELTPGYHMVALDENVMAIPRLAQTTGRSAEIPPDYISAMEKGYDYLLGIMTPDRSAPKFNDSWAINMPYVLNRGLGFFPTRNDWKWVATSGAQGTPPAWTSIAFPNAGYYIMRSSWTTTANYVAFDGGLPGYFHTHQDKLNLVFWVYGREILFDGGGGSYEDSPWRVYSEDTFSHNTVLVDGLPQRWPLLNPEANVARVPNDVVWQTTATFDFVAGSYEGAYALTDRWGPAQPVGPAKHTRRVLFTKPYNFVVVADTMEPTVAGSSHTYQARWHLLPTSKVFDSNTRAVTTNDAGLSNLAIIPLQKSGLQVDALSNQTTPELLGWNIRKDMDLQYVPATTVKHTRTGAGVQTFLTLLYPLAAGQANPVTTVTAVSTTQTRFTLSNGTSYLVTVPTGARDLITVVQE